MIIRKLRLQRGWSQEQLSQMSGLSIRTIQRVERGHKAGLESLKSLAAVFEVELTSLQQEPEMTNNKPSSELNQARLTLEEEQAIEYVRGIKEFYNHATVFAIVIPLLFIINVYLTPSYMWVWWCILGWGIGLVSHAVSSFEVFSIFDAKWEKKQIEKRLGRDL